MAYASDAGLLVLHGLRIKGFAEHGVLVDLTGLAPSDVTCLLEQHRAAGLVTRSEGRVAGWALTTAGRQRAAELLGAELTVAGCQAVVADAYERFFELNPGLLAVCTDWQVRTVDGQQVVNDHTDGAYDAAAVERLRAVDELAQPVCSDLATVLRRFRRYGPRLGTAFGKVVSGEHDWFTKPVVDSYHTVWFELHEDLLATLGLQRAEERAS